MRSRWIYTGLLLCLILVLSIPVFAEGVGDRVRIGSDIEIPKDQTVNGDSVTIFGNQKIEGHVNGSIVTIFGNLELYGESNDDVVTIFGKTSLHEGSKITGDFVTVGGKLERANNTTISGDVTTVYMSNMLSNMFHNLRFNFHMPDWWIYPFKLNAILLSIIVALILIYFFLPHLRRIIEFVQADPMKAGLTGLIGVVVVAFATVLLCVTIIGIPIAMLFGLVIWAAFVMGSVAVYLLIGERLVEQFQWNVNQYVAGILGAILIGVAAMLPWIGWLIKMLISLMGFGAVIKTKFGTGKPWIK